MYFGGRFSLKASLPSWKSSLTLESIISALSAITASCSDWNGRSHSWRFSARVERGETLSAMSFAYAYVASASWASASTPSR